MSLDQSFPQFSHSAGGSESVLGQDEAANGILCGVTMTRLVAGLAALTNVSSDGQDSMDQEVPTLAGGWLQSRVLDTVKGMRDDNPALADAIVNSISDQGPARSCEFLVKFLNEAGALLDLLDEPVDQNKRKERSSNTGTPVDSPARKFSLLEVSPPQLEGGESAI
jgi:hypothetical protein